MKAPARNLQSGVAVLGALLVIIFITIVIKLQVLKKHKDDSFDEEFLTNQIEDLTLANAKLKEQLEIASECDNKQQATQRELKMLQDQLKSMRVLMSNEWSDQDSKQNGNTAAVLSSQAHPVYKPKDMREVLDWESFDKEYVYSWKRYWQVMKHIGAWKTELEEAVNFGKGVISDSSYKWEHGNTRIDPLRGTDYILDYATTREDKTKKYKRVQLFRPFGALEVVSDATSDAFETALYVVLPLSDGRREMFAKFMEYYKKFALKVGSPPVFLVISYFRSKPTRESQDMSVDLRDAVNILKGLEEHNKLQYKLLYPKGDFSRGVGLETGARYISSTNKKSDPVMLFIDVDMKFSMDFLFRCRANPIRGRAAYFPIVFSKFKDSPWSGISHASGAWRNYGLGMVCMYLSDFLDLDGFSKTIKGWGQEDVDFYQRLIRGGAITAIRAVEEGLIHEWHPKYCDPSLTESQMNDCLGSMADWEGSKKSMGLRMFKAEQEVAKLERKLHDLEPQEDNINDKHGL